MRFIFLIFFLSFNTENLFLSLPKADKEVIKGIIQTLGPTAGDCLPVLQSSRDTSLTWDVIKYVGSCEPGLDLSAQLRFLDH